MKERQIEKHLTLAVKAMGGLCPKWVSPGLDGVPDRIILLPGGRIAFAEIKSPGERPRRLQEVCIARLRRLGFTVYVIDDSGQIPGILEKAGDTK